MDWGREFTEHELKTFKAKKGIKIEFNVTYSPKMNGIAQRTNSLIVTNTRCLLLDSNLDQSLLPNNFETATYLFNQTLSSTLDYDIPLEAWL